MPHIQESHPEPDERILMPKFDSKAESQSCEILDGDFRFEIVAVDNAISKGAKTRGSDTREVKLKFFKDAEFAKPAAQWTETFIAHESTDWKYSVFAKCVKVELQDGLEFDIDATWIGRRGWATCKKEADQANATKPVADHKFYNRVRGFITNKERLAPNVAAKQPTNPDDDLSF